MTRIKAIIFDLDGVLIETEFFQWQGWLEPLKKFGFSLSKEEYLGYAGKTGAIIEEELLKKFGLNVPKGTLLHEKEKQLMEWFKTKPLKLMPYAKETLEFFVAKKMPMALASGGPKKEIILKLQRTGLLSFFKTIVSRDDVSRGKPFPDIYLETAKRIKTKPENCLVFEDTQYGLQSAKAAGMKCFAIPNEFSTKQDFSQADKTVPSLQKAIEYLHKEL